MSKCRDCDEVIDEWREERGKWVPYSLQIHYKSRKHIEAVRGDKKPRAKGSRNRADKKLKAGRVPDLSEEDQQMADTLTGQGWNAETVEHLLPHAQGATFEARFRAVMAYADSEDR